MPAAAPQASIFSTTDCGGSDSSPIAGVQQCEGPSEPETRAYREFSVVKDEVAGLLLTSRTVISPGSASHG